jgi:hypothetical protein
MRRFYIAIIELSSLALPAAVRAADRPVVFETDIVPLLEKHCLKCHQAGKAKGGLDVSLMALLLRGGDNGVAVVPGKPEESLLVQRVEKGEMPPPKAGKLEQPQRDLIRRWVAAGARSTATATVAGGGDGGAVSEEERRFWAFRPPARPVVPTIAARDLVRTPIDAFLLARLEAKGLSFNPDAPREVLLRRLCFDLLGLPPTPEQLAEFLADDRADAYERLVDRLLASPAYGERWGRHWMDLAGYADSDGYLAADRLRPEAWRYRDYVIQAYNEDCPYDQFTTEQLAGDELSDWRKAEELTPLMKRQLTATGFLRTASDPTYPGYTEPNEIHQVLGDTMQIVGSTFLGLTIQCARCHAHKSDPLSQRDYYALQAIFLPALDPARWIPSEVRGVVSASPAEQRRINQYNQKVTERLNALNAELAELTARFRKKRIAEHLAGAEVDKDAAVVAKLTAALEAPKEKRTPEQQRLVARLAQSLAVTEADLAAAYPEFKQEVDKLHGAIAAEQAMLKPRPPLLRVVADLDGKPPQGQIRRRGDYTKPGIPVAAGIPVVMAPAGYRFEVNQGMQTSGRRLALARWLTAPGHPLTARVHVNRMWKHHFGRGLVATVANFGQTGSRPTHPELLDWLATEFVGSGWRLKAMHRLMVTSTAYRQTSDLDPVKKAADPRNELLGAWRPRRHEGEVVRDSLLAVAGKLHDQRFGPPAPVAPRGDGAVETDDTPQCNRRSIYLIVRRSQHVTLLDLFDAPMMEINCPDRSVATVPLQALVLMNGPFAERCAMALANRLLASAADETNRIDLAYRLLYGRPPRPQESERVRRFLSDTMHEAAGGKSADTAAMRTAWVQLALVLLNSNEFLYVH